MRIAQDFLKRASIHRLSGGVLFGFVLGATVLFACSHASLAETRSSLVEVVPQLGHQLRVRAVALSSDGRLLVTGGVDRAIKLWDVNSAREMRSFVGHAGAINTIAFFPNSRQFVSAGADKIIKLWDAETGSELRSFTGHTMAVNSVAVSADGKFVISGSDDSTIKLWDADSGRELRTFTGHTQRVGTVAFSSDGRLIVSGSDDHLIKLWDSRSGRELRTIEGHLGNVNSVAFSPDGQFIVSGSADRTVGLWNVNNGGKIRTYSGSTASVYSVAFSPDGQRIVSGSDDYQVIIWDTESGRELHTFSPMMYATTRVNSVAFSSDGRRIVVNSSSTAMIWDADSGYEVHSFKDHAHAVTSTAFSPDGRSVISGDQIIKLWSAESGRVVRTYPEGAGGINSVAFSPNGRRIVSGSNDGTIRLWDIESREGPRTFAAGDNVTSVVFSPDGRKIASAWYYPGYYKDSGGLILWDVASGRRIRSLDHVNADSAAFSSDGRLIISGGEDKADVRLWDVDSGRQLRKFNEHSEPAQSVAAFSPNDQLIASGSTDYSIKLWETKTGQQRLTLVGHTDRIKSLAFSSDGSKLVSSGSDLTIRIWDVRTGRELQILKGHSGLVSSVGFSRDGRRILSGSADGTTKLWDAESGALLGTEISVSEGEWVFLTPEGFFDGSVYGARNLSVVRGLEVYSIDQFRDALFRPDLVKAKLAGDPNGVVKAAAARLDLTKVVDSGNAPKVAITSPADGSATAAGEINVEGAVTEQGGGVGRIEWRLNGQPVNIDTRGFQRVQENTSPPGTPGAAIKISQKMVLDAGDNVVEVVAYNDRGLVASQPSKITIKATGPVTITKPRLFVLAVGVNDYYDGRLKLNFAVPDARAIAASFEKAGTGFYESVKAVTVLDADVTRANLEKVFAQLATEVKTSDVFVFFIAGHGRTLDGHYYFLPQDFHYRDQGSFAESGLSQEQWQKWITLIQARKSVLIYDTCESGTVADDNVVVASRGLQRVEEQAVAYEKLRDATGRTTLAASADTQPALEGYHGHGVFSYVVMEALEKAQTNASGLIEVTGLISYVDDRVPDISYQAFHQHQVPQNKMLGSNFAIGRPTAMVLDAGSSNTTPAAPTAKIPAEALPSSVPTETAAPIRPTHVIIMPTDVFNAASISGPVVEHLAPGTQVSLIETKSGWSVVARDGKRLGYVKETALLQLK